ncbi:hypothetical protein [Streptomyces griseocarneus]|uniref:Uncharacterized protein n=1 Tax=Streptomyces griseocarneus TaxID=51201 RepID=A0ABX7RX38_9ACTN|nr:hypothetical protein [Streptomyces griseocarneus]QSY51263.1 hypothetical protein J3S04_10485 [Streptomyces griseocarneus]
MLAARGEVAAAEDYVATHRGAVGCPARTRLAAAGRELAGATTVTAALRARSWPGRRGPWPSGTWPAPPSWAASSWRAAAGHVRRRGTRARLTG